MRDIKVKCGLVSNSLEVFHGDEKLDLPIRAMNIELRPGELNVAYIDLAGVELQEINAEPKYNLFGYGDVAGVILEDGTTHMLPGKQK